MAEHTFRNDDLLHMKKVIIGYNSLLFYIQLITLSFSQVHLIQESLNGKIYVNADFKLDLNYIIYFKWFTRCNFY